MNLPVKLSALRKSLRMTQDEVAAYVSAHGEKAYTNRSVSQWENGAVQPNIETFLLLCELYGVSDIQKTFRGLEPKYVQKKANRRIIKLYDAAVSAGTGSFLDSDDYADFTCDETVPHETDFAVRVSGDSMLPRFIHNQVIFVRSQQSIGEGEIGVFCLNGNSFVKMLGKNQLISLNPRYKPIAIDEDDSLLVFGKVMG